jgi:hypothetical protein
VDIFDELVALACAVVVFHEYCGKMVEVSKGPFVVVTDGVFQSLS